MASLGGWWIKSKKKIYMAQAFFCPLSQNFNATKNQRIRPDPDPHPWIWYISSSIFTLITMISNPFMPGSLMLLHLWKCWISILTLTTEISNSFMFVLISNLFWSCIFTLITWITLQPWSVSLSLYYHVASLSRVHAPEI